MSKPIENDTFQKQFRRKLEILEPTILTTEDFEYTLSDVDFGSLIIVNVINGSVKLTNFTPSNSGHIRIVTARDTQPGDTLTISIEIAAFDLDNVQNFAVVSTIELTDYGVTGMDLYYDKATTKWYASRITSKKATGIIAETGGVATPDGFIGEIKENFVSGVALNATGTAITGSLTLGPGKWRLFGYFSMAATGVTSDSRSGGITRVSGLWFTIGNYNTTPLTASDSLWQAPAIERIVNQTTTETYRMTVEASMSGGSFSCAGAMQAIRIP